MLKVPAGAILMLMSPQDARTKQRILLSHVSLCMLQWFKKTDVGCRWWQATGRDQDSSSSCLTLETSSPCHFPFEHNGFLHYSCIPLTPQVNFGIMLFILVLRKMIWLLWEKNPFNFRVANSVLLLLIHQPPLGSIARYKVSKTVLKPIFNRKTDGSLPKS